MTGDGRRMPSDGKSSHYLWQGELTINLIKIYKIDFLNKQKNILHTVCFHTIFTTFNNMGVLSLALHHIYDIILT
jgi:hypothetical protein